MDDISAMTNAELDEALAVEVMGWRYYKGLWFDVKGDDTNLRSYEYCIAEGIDPDIYAWIPTADIGQAMMCLDEVRRHHIIVIESRPYVECWSIRLTTWDKQACQWEVSNETLERAICEAVLKATRKKGRE